MAITVSEVFFTDSHPVLATNWLDDARVSAALRLSVQLLSNTIRARDAKLPRNAKLYKKFNTVKELQDWCDYSKENFTWLLCYAFSLETRLGKPGVAEVIRDWFSDNSHLLHLAGGSTLPKLEKGAPVYSKDTFIHHQTKLRYLWANQSPRPTWNGQPTSIYFEG